MQSAHSDSEEKPHKHKHHHHSIAGQSRLFVNVALFIEAALFVSSLIGQPVSAAAASSVKEFSGKNTTIAEMFLQSAVARAVDSAFWTSIAAFVIICVLLPTAVGVIFAKPAHPQSVFGQTVTRFALHYLLQPFALAQHLSALDQRLFYVTNGIALLMAFWEHIQLVLEKSH